MGRHGPMKGAISEVTSSVATILGMNVSVISCTWVSACRRDIEMPTTMAAIIAGLEAKIMAQIAACTMSRASA